MSKVAKTIVHDCGSKDYSRISAESLSTSAVPRASAVSLSTVVVPKALVAVISTSAAAVRRESLVALFTVAMPRALAAVLSTGAPTVTFYASQGARQRPHLWQRVRELWMASLAMAATERIFVAVLFAARRQNERRYALIATRHRTEIVGADPCTVLN